MSEDTNELTVRFEGYAFRDLVSIGHFLKDKKPPKEVIDLAVVLLHQAVGKRIILIDARGREEKIYLWK